MNLYTVIFLYSDRDSTAGLAIRYALKGTGIE
jgi:hypothetical protein